MAKEREIERWITVRGSHVPLYEGQTVKEAVQSVVNRSDATAKQIQKDADKKEAEIAKNKAEADERKEQKPLPRRLYLDDIPAEKANQVSDVLDLKTKERYRFKEGTTLTQVHAFAGRGCLKEFEKAEKYAQRYPKSGNRKEDWQHCSGVGYVVRGSDTAKAEIHWVQGKDNKIREAFIKEYLDD